MTERTSRTSRWSALLAASVLAVVQPGPAPADPGNGMGTTIGRHAKLHDDCGDGVGAPTGLYRSCGEYPVSLPITFAYNPAGAGVAGADFTDAVNGAADGWNHPFGFQTPSPFGEVVTISGSSTRGKAKDGVNTIVWGDPDACGAPGAIAVACFWYAGPAGSDRHRIVETDIILNASEVWLQASGADELAGTATGTAGVAASVAWHDLQSALTHEFGHAIGLEHFGSTAAWPTTLSDGGKHLQTMYRYDPRGSTVKRSLDVGDILGLNHVYDTVND